MLLETKILFKIYWIIERTMLKSMAHQNPLTSKPWTTFDVSSTNAALITKVNNPSVRILIGRVINIRKGLISVFITPRKRATRRAEKIPLTEIPGIRYAVIPTESVINNHFKSNDIAYRKNDLFMVKFVRRDHPQR